MLVKAFHPDYPDCHRATTRAQRGAWLSTTIVARASVISPLPMPKHTTNPAALGATRGQVRLIFLGEAAT
jgi:hypothetical protein